MTQERLEQDIELLHLAQTRVIGLLQAQTRYKFVYSERILRATRHLELLIQELERQDHEVSSGSRNSNHKYLYDHNR